MSNENIFLFYAIYTGVYITFIYDIIRVFRRIIPHSNGMVSLEDIGFWIYCSGKVFVLMYRFSNGMLRWFAVLGAVAGMCFYIKFISAFFVKYASAILLKVRKIILKIVCIILRPIAKIYIKIKKKLTMTIKMLRISVSGLHNSKHKVP